MEGKILEGIFIVKPGLEYCQRVGNIMGATLYLSLAGTIDKGTFDLA
jgi:polyketide biosynthesis 3-hydroxy-3-methylglutaryl-CoA synthase-like enzyme PksG